MALLAYATSEKDPTQIFEWDVALIHLTGTSAYPYTHCLVKHYGACQRCPAAQAITRASMRRLW